MQSKRLDRFVAYGDVLEGPGNERVTSRPLSSEVTQTALAINHLISFFCVCFNCAVYQSTEILGLTTK